MRKTVPLITKLVLGSAFVFQLFAQANIAFNGDAEFRVRYHYVMLKSFDGKDSSNTPDLTTQYSWNLKWKIIVNENLLFGVRLSNPSGYSTDKIDENLANVSSSRFNILSIPELYFKWSVAKFSLAAGIIPVMPNTVLNLAVYETTNFVEAGTSPWSVLMNNSQKGLDFGLQLVKNETMTLGMNVIAAMAKDAAGTDTANALVHDQVRLLCMFPMSLAGDKISVQPAMDVRFNAYRSLDLEDANHAIVGGCDVAAKVNDQLKVYAGAAGGVFNNSCQEGDSAWVEVTVNKIKDTVLTPIIQIDPFGVLINAGVEILPGYGKGIVDFNFGRARDGKAVPSLNKDLLYWDIKYELPVKSLTIQPRCRIWHYTTEDLDKTKTVVRPELILKAKF